MDLFFNKGNEGGFNCNKILISFYDSGSIICTHCPSLSIQGEISRNIVGVPEGVPGSN